MKTLGDRLKYARELKGVSQVVVAKHLGISNKTISGYERNVSEPDLDTLGKLAEFYNVEVDYLFENISNRIEKLYEEKKSISKEIKEVKVDIAINVNDILILLEDFDEVWDELEVDQKKEIATQVLGEKIYI